MSADVTIPAAPVTEPAAEKPLPVTIIRPRRGWQSLELDEVWRYRHLLGAFLWRDLKAGQKQTVLGVLWLFIAPLVSVAVFTLVFGRLAQLPSDGIPYPLFVFAGQLVWNAFAPAVQASATSVVANSHFIQKVYFPRLIIPLSAGLSGVVNLAITSVCLLGLMVCFGNYPGWTALLAVPLLLLVLVTALGIGLLLAPLYVEYRDIGPLLTYGLQVGFYLTPVVYPISLVSSRDRWLLALNPLAGYVGAFRWCLYGGELPFDLLAASVVATLMLLTAGAFWFARRKGRFADVV